MEPGFLKTIEVLVGYLKDLEIVKFGEKLAEILLGEYNSNSKKNHEPCIESLLVTYFKLCDLNITSQEPSEKGIADLIIQTREHCFIIELKVDQSAMKALNQILEKHYYHKDAVLEKKKICIGLNYSSKNAKTIDSIAFQILRPGVKSKPKEFIIVEENQKLVAKQVSSD